MSNTVVIHIIRSLVLVFVQVLVLFEIQEIGGLSIVLYPLFIILLPISIPNWMLVLLGFFTGILVDIFTNTPGVNSFATTTIAFLRPFIFQVIAVEYYTVIFDIVSYSYSSTVCI